MRITPMAVFTAHLRPELSRQLIVADVEMTHPNKAVQDMIFTYCLAIHYLLNNPEDELRAQNAFDVALKQANGFTSGYTS
jgi:hypothetical protein